MLAEFLITFRETLEAALIIGVVLAFLRRTKNNTYLMQVYLGITAGIVLSLFAGIALSSMPSLLEEAAEPLFEGTTMLLAALLVSWMIISMKNQRDIAGAIEKHVKLHTDSGYGLGLALFVTISVFREGSETALFLASLHFQSSSFSLFGALLGISAAVALGFLMFEFAIKANLKFFLNASGLLLILFAGGLLVQAVHEFSEAGILPQSPPLWSSSSLLSPSSSLGALLKSLFGYVSQPTALQLLAYCCFIGAFSYFYFFYKFAGGKSSSQPQ